MQRNGHLMTATKTKFKVGDTVYSMYHGYGVIVNIHEEPCIYPITVEWDNYNSPFMEEVNSFTADGYLLAGSNKDTNLKITVVNNRHNHRKLLNRFRAFLRG